MLHLFLLFLCVVPSLAGCVFQTDPVSLQPSVTSIPISFSCDSSYDNLDVQLRLTKDDSSVAYMDTYVLFETIRITSTAPIVRNISIPSGSLFLNCDNIKLYYSVVYVVDYFPDTYFESSPFLPLGICPDWNCDPSYYSSQDGCDCACGSHDYDCDTPGQAVYNCLPDVEACLISFDDTCAAVTSPLLSPSECSFFPTNTEICNFRQFEDEVLQLQFACGTDYEGDDVDVKLYQDVAYSFDESYVITSISSLQANVIYEMNVTIPSGFKSCSPEELYFYLDGPGFSNVQSCSFIPDHGLMPDTCNAITSPLAGDVVPMSGTDITWHLDPTAKWGNKSMQLYLYKDVYLFFDPYWMVGEDLATTETMLMNANDMGIQTTTESNWYIAGYYRTPAFFGLLSYSSLAMEGGRFTLNDDSSSNYYRIKQCDNKYTVTTCDSVDGAVANDFCRFVAGDFIADLADVDISIGALQTCSTNVRVSMNMMTIFYYLDGDTMQKTVHNIPMNETFPLDLNSVVSYEKTVLSLDVVSLVNPALSAVVSGTIEGKIVASCIDNALSISFTIGGAVSIATVEVVGKDLTVYTEELIDLSPLNTELSSPCTSPTPTPAPTPTPTPTPPSPSVTNSTSNADIFLVDSASSVRMGGFFTTLTLFSAFAFAVFL